MKRNIVENVRKYLESKYSVDLSSIEIKEPLVGIPGSRLYQPSIVSLPRIYLPSIPHSIVGILTILYLPYGLPITLPITAYFLARGILPFLSRKNILIHEFTHAAVERLSPHTYNNENFYEALATYEALNAPYKSTIAAKIHYLLVFFHFPKYRKWHKIFSIANGKVKYTEKIKEKLSDPNLKRLVDDLRSMNPSELVEKFHELEKLEKSL